MSIYLDSEIGRLKRVIVHSPGAEIEQMTPESARQLLYHDIIPISVVSKEHEKLKAFLSTIAEVYELRELVQRAVDAGGEAKAALVRSMCVSYRAEELFRMDTPALVGTLISGLPARKETLTDYLSNRLYDLPPLPNLYFMRDGAMVFRDRVLIGAMAHRVRTNESLLLKAAFSYTHELDSGGVLFDGVLEGRSNLRLEGGDFLPVNRNTILVGISERTSAEAVDRLTQNLVETLAEPFHVFVVMLPEGPSTIHLDMIFTLVDYDRALVHEPAVLSSARARVIRMDIAPGREARIRDVPGIIEGLGEVGVEVSPIRCGGTEAVYQQREQWLSGTNVFAFAPGKVVGYDCNEATAESFAAAGFLVRSVDSFLDGSEQVWDHEQLLVLTPGVELARGGGGARCMTLPVEREQLQL
jgi:arginine deiminase